MIYSLGVSTRLDKNSYINFNAEVFAIIAGNFVVSHQLYYFINETGRGFQLRDRDKFIELPTDNNLCHPQHTYILINENKMEIMKTKTHVNTQHQIFILTMYISRIIHATTVSISTFKTNHPSFLPLQDQPFHQQTGPFRCYHRWPRLRHCHLSHHPFYLRRGGRPCRAQIRQCRHAYRVHRSW
jgi:hypothetical protein